MRHYFFLLFTLLALSASAENISTNQAKKIAKDFFSNNRPQLQVNELKMVFDGETPESRSTGANPALYVFDNPNGKGFVIVAGDDMAQPILGYSYENDFPSGQLPEHVEGWLNSLKQQINDGRKYGVVSKPNSRSLTRAGEVIVQLKTAQWNQNAPYNQYSPTINGKKTPTGCTITAGAIVMKYHQWPKQGTGTIPGYTTGTHKIEMPAIELGHTYEWSKMPDVYKTNQYSQEQAHQVARLMADLGTMAKADYDLGGTGATSYYFAELFPVYMDYDKSALYRDRHEYSDSKWHELMKTELQQNRPVIYSGHNEESGHCFVLDGYTSDDFYSVNWGWGGYCNGYFLLNALVPSGSGTGGNNDHYNFYQSAVTGLMPNQGGDYVELITLGEKGLSSERTTFERYTPFKITTEWLGNSGTTNFTGTFLWALTDKNGKIKENLATLNVSNLPSRHGWHNLERNCTITVPLAIGDRIRVFYKSTQTPKWTLIEGGEECVWELLVTDEYSIEETTRIRFQKKERILIVNTKNGVNIKFTNNRGTNLNHLCETKENETIIHTNGLPAGNYLLNLEKTFENKDVRIKLGESTQQQ